jgi:hypothetical protein
MPTAWRSQLLSLNGILLLIVALSLAGAGFTPLRLQFAGLRVHVYLIVVGAFFPLLAITRLHLIPARHLSLLTLFASFYFATTLPAKLHFAEGIKVFAAVATIITMAMLVRSWNDFVSGVLGMCLAIGILAVKGLESDIGDAGINAFDSCGHRNTFSLYALPPILLGGYVLLNRRPCSLLTRLLILGSIAAGALVICLNVNRSGWVGLIIVILLLVREKSTKAMVLILPIAVALFFIITTLFGATHLKNRLEGTVNSKQSDRLRVELVRAGATIAMENPLLGVTPQELPFELATKLGWTNALVYSHNIWVQIAAGSGLVCFALLLYIGFMLARWRPPVPLSLPERLDFTEAQKMLRSVLLVWAVRGFFTHEILYSPAFCMAIGLTLGLELCAVKSAGRIAPVPGKGAIGRPPRLVGSSHLS